ncbi:MULTISPECIES: hypothetical protein [unclassified Pseudoalteromonas]|uniref:hypothetical protein n=1 Tax=unclassified Pseudoalteromonas TaxID=194690 RepID=UPI0005AAF128|nr:MULTISPECIES: hypothetical protein [unclassified Pseudoalteromonas]
MPIYKYNFLKFTFSELFVAEFIAKQNVELSEVLLQYFEETSNEETAVSNEMLIFGVDEEDAQDSLLLLDGFPADRYAIYYISLSYSQFQDSLMRKIKKHLALFDLRRELSKIKNMHEVEISKFSQINTIFSDFELMVDTQKAQLDYQTIPLEKINSAQKQFESSYLKKQNAFKLYPDFEFHPIEDHFLIKFDKGGSVNIKAAGRYVELFDAKTMDMLVQILLSPNGGYDFKECFLVKVNKLYTYYNEDLSSDKQLVFAHFEKLIKQSELLKDKVSANEEIFELIDRAASSTKKNQHPQNVFSASVPNGSFQITFYKITEQRFDYILSPIANHEEEYLQFFNERVGKSYQLTYYRSVQGKNQSELIQGKITFNKFTGDADGESEIVTVQLPQPECSNDLTSFLKLSEIKY